MSVKDRKWWRNGVVYQIYPRSFCDSNGDGIGDIPGIISKLDYLKELGVDIIWLSPVYASPNCDNGYDISDYRAIHPDFGTMDDMEMLIREAKIRDIRIIMDLVVNHTSDEHQWFKKAVEGDHKYKNYYIFKEGKNGKLPNNWGSFFGSDCWEKVPGEDNLYYLHLFDKKQPDLNWHNPAVYDEVCNILRFWLDKGIAGFRCDVINVLYKNSLEDGKKKIALTGLEYYHSTEGNHDILRRLREDVLSKYDCFTVGETVLVDTKMAMDLCGSDRKELDMVFGFEHMECDQIGIKWFKTKYRPKRLIKALDRWQHDMEWNANYFENHDQPRSVSRFGNDDEYHDISCKMLAGLLLSLRGTPYIYEGQEIGMTNGDFKDLSEMQDVESHTVDGTMKSLHFPDRLRDKLLKLTTRDNARTPMQWSGDVGAGFTKGTPWLKINANHAYINVEKQLKDDDSVLAFYKKMIAFRKDSETLQWGEYERLKSPENVYAFRRYTDDKNTVVICNMTAKKQPVWVQAVKTRENSELVLKFSNYLSDEDKASSDLFSFRPFEFCVFEEE
ncbi:MAG: alpha-amylase family glycosyl hydrolase [Lachnospiraceae bacterium]|nr:alpha-amylase family glycosyl hydrolase [Lachnospiraceae bacterium]